MRRFLFIIIMFMATARLYAPSVTLAWDPNEEPDIDRYQLYWWESDELARDMKKAFHPNTVTTVTNLLAGTTYHFVVTAVNTAELESGPSNLVTYTVPPDPVDPRVPKTPQNIRDKLPEGT